MMFNSTDNQQQMQAQQQQPQLSQEDLVNSHGSVNTVMDGLVKLVSLPHGDLTKKSVFDEASEMISNGAFPTPEGKQHLIAQLANLPDDEAGIRKVLSEHLLAVANMSNQLHNTFGPPPTQSPTGAM